MLGHFEYQVLKAVQGVQGKAYGVPIRAFIEANFNRTVSFGALYTVLGRLSDKGFVKSEILPATAERGGRRKKAYVLSGTGQAAIREKESTMRIGMELGGAYA
ncbi:MAG: PadR family transcriptional regulator [Maricaulaceae bacterium]